ncbi:hypothetical protein pb186bvf_013342 [Paramecium bursaria]
MQQYLEFFQKEKSLQIDQQEISLKHIIESNNQNKDLISSINYDQKIFQQNLLENYYEKSQNLKQIYNQIDESLRQLTLLEAEIQNLQ